MASILVSHSFSARILNRSRLLGTPTCLRNTGNSHFAIALVAVRIDEFGFEIGMQVALRQKST